MCFMGMKLGLSHLGNRLIDCVKEGANDKGMEITVCLEPLFGT